MGTAIRALALAAILASGVVFAGPFEDGVTAFQRGDVTTAIGLWRSLAEQGDSEAQYTLGFMYYKGQAVPLDYPQAAYWFRKAAEKGHEEAQCSLGLMYTKGQGVPKDYVMAYFWLRLVSDACDGTAIKARGLLDSLMSPAQISEAQRLAESWQPEQVVLPSLPPPDGAFSSIDPQLLTIPNVLLSFLVTWGLGLLPPLLIRYAIIRRPVSKAAASWIAGGFSVFFWIAFRAIKMEAGERLGSGVVWLLVFLVARWILSRGYLPMLNDSVREAAASLRRFDEGFDSDLSRFPVPGIPNIQSVLPMTKNRKEVRVRVEFQCGAMASILKSMYTGAEGGFDAYCQSAITRAFNQGFLMNVGKGLWRDFENFRDDYGIIYQKGMAWGRSYAERHGSDDVYSAEIAEPGTAVPTSGPAEDLIIAARRGHVPAVQALLARGADVNAKGDQGYTALMVASGVGHLDVVQTLLAKGADINVRSYDGITPLMVASREGHVDVVQVLLAKGADVNAKADSGRTALVAAVASANLQLVEALLAKGADANAEIEGITVLLAACRKGYLDMVKALLVKGADVNAKGAAGMTALLVASREGHFEMVKALLAKGADVNAKCDAGTALMAASMKGHVDVVKVLLAKGADVNAKADMGITVLELVEDADVRALLIKAGAK